MGFFKNLGDKLVEAGYLEGDPTPADPLAGLSAEELALIERQVEAETAQPEIHMPPVRRPQPRGGSSLSALTPEAIKKIVDGEIEAAGQPAYGLWKKLDDKFKPTLPNDAMRAAIVIEAMGTHDLKQAHILYDVDEAMSACQSVQTEIELERDDQIASQVDDLEADAKAKLIRVQELRAQADQLEAEAKAQQTEAQQRRESITSAVQAALQYIQERIGALKKVRENLMSENPGLIPEEPPGNVRPS